MTTPAITRAGGRLGGPAVAVGYRIPADLAEFVREYARDRNISVNLAISEIINDARLRAAKGE